MFQPNSNDLSSLVDPELPPKPQEIDLSFIVKEVERCHLRSQVAACEVVLWGFEAGVRLLRAKDMTPHGDWTTRLKTAIRDTGSKVTVRTCQRYMNIARILLGLPESPAELHVESSSKTTRASFLRFLSEHKLSSMRSVLVLEDLSSPPREESVSHSNTNLGVLEQSSITSSDENWLTPGRVVDCVIELFTTIDLDPCGAPEPQFHLSATHTVCPPEDGLDPSLPWQGRVFVHPPLTNVAGFVRQSVKAVQGQVAEEALLFIPAETDATHMSVLQPYPKGFLHDRPTFSTPEGKFVQPTTPYMIAFISQNPDRVERFADVMGVLADIYHPHLYE